MLQLSVSLGSLGIKVMGNILIWLFLIAWFLKMEGNLRTYKKPMRTQGEYSLKRHTDKYLSS